MKLLRHLLLSAICVAVLGATTPTVSANSLDQSYASSTSASGSGSHEISFDAIVGVDDSNSNASELGHDTAPTTEPVNDKREHEREHKHLKHQVGEVTTPHPTVPNLPKPHETKPESNESPRRPEKREEKPNLRGDRDKKL